MLWLSLLRGRGGSEENKGIILVYSLIVPENGGNDKFIGDELSVLVLGNIGFSKSLNGTVGLKSLALCNGVVGLCTLPAGCRGPYRSNGPPWWQACRRLSPQAFICFLDIFYTRSRGNVAPVKQSVNIDFLYALLLASSRSPQRWVLWL